MKEVKFLSHSVNETISFAKKIAFFLRPGDILALSGELGSGKTWFTKGIALGLNIPADLVTSPSFTLVNEYQGKFILFHIDAYRLKDKSDFLSAGLDEYFFKDGIVIMEWADRWPEILPNNSLVINFGIIDERTREISIIGRHKRGIEIIENLLK